MKKLNSPWIQVMIKNLFKTKLRFVKKSEPGNIEEFYWWYCTEVKKNFFARWTYVQGTGSFDHDLALEIFRVRCKKAEVPQKVVLLNYTANP